MAFGSDDSPPRHHEKRSKQNNDLAGSSKPSGHTKAAYPHDAVGARGRGHASRAEDAQAQAPAQAFADPPPHVGAA